MVQEFVPAGRFLMGSADGDLAAKVNEKPQHEVYLDAFWMDRAEVSNGMYARCVQAGVCRAPKSSASATRRSYFGNPQFDNYPVIWVARADAEAYFHWAGRRLPTEAEWEKAARGTDGRLYPWGNQVPDAARANFAGNGGDTNEMGAAGPEGDSPYQIWDMSGRPP